jgi:hypothetical protein
MKTNLIKQFLLMAIIAASATITARAQFNTNLLLNADGQAGNMTDWTVVANGGNGWYVGTGFGSALPGSVNAFATSYGWDVRSQTIDLLAAGFTTAQLDSAPTISISDWVRGYIVNGSYFMNVQLEDASHSVISSWSDGSQSSPLTIGPSSGWIEVTGSLQNYGSGLRYIVFEDGGKDSMFWAGNYGAAFDASSIIIQAVPEPTTLAFAGLGVLGCVLMFWQRRS